MICQCCGFNPDDTSVLALGRKIRLTQMERRVFDCLAKNFGGEVMTDRLLDVMYCDAEDGGAVTASNVLSVMVMNLRHKLAPHNLVIDAARGPGAYRRLRWSTQSERVAGK